MPVSKQTYNLKIDYRTEQHNLANRLETEPIPCRIQDPGIVVRALHAGVEAQGLPGELPGVEGAGVGEGAEGLTLDITLVLPLREVTESGQLCGVLHPLDNLESQSDKIIEFETDDDDDDYLEHGDKVDIVSVDHLGDELNKLPLESLVRFDPGSAEMEAKWSSVAAEMPLKIVSQHASKLVRIHNV